MSVLFYPPTCGGSSGAFRQNCFKPLACRPGSSNLGSACRPVSSKLGSGAVFRVCPAQPLLDQAGGGWPPALCLAPLHTDRPCALEKKKVPFPLAPPFFLTQQGRSVLALGRADGLRGFNNSLQSRSAKGPHVYRRLSCRCYAVGIAAQSVYDWRAGRPIARPAPPGPPPRDLPRVRPSPPPARGGAARARA